MKLTVDMIEWPVSTVMGDGGAAFAPTHHALQPQRTHQPLSPGIPGRFKIDPSPELLRAAAISTAKMDELIAS